MTEPVRLPTNDVAVVTPASTSGAESASLAIFPVRLPVNDVAVITPVALIFLPISIALKRVF